MFFSRKKVPAENNNSQNIWLISYADMTTTLVVMFIALSALNMDQTGIRITNALGSFVQSQNASGISGMFPSWKEMTNWEQVSPRWQIPGQPDDGAELRRVIDAEEEQLNRFLREVERQFTVTKLPGVRGRTVFESHEPLRSTPPFLKPSHAERLAQIVPVLRRNDYRVYVVCWTPSPAPPAWSRAAETAQRVTEEIASDYRLNAQAQSRLIPLGQPWWYPDIPRPELSFIIVRLDMSQ